ncbi:MAG: PD-(D/E)XK nuclease family protein [Methanomassiliicoccaceae archaeon]|nr:PD-(D/E)XK nuclease family protein [Methanomassiliicoccaceae archaeon]
MRRAKSIDELYEEVRGYDLVITNDAALATALNGRIDVPRIGGFAYTPRHIAGNEAVPFFGSGVLGDLKIISKISKETGYNFKHIHSELENIRRIRRHKKDVQRYLYSNSSKEIYSSFLGLKTAEKLMGSYVPEERKFFEEKKVAVIGIEFFDDLDKHFIPIDHDEIDIFCDGGYEVDVIYEVGNDRQLAENTVGMISVERADDTAIVLDTTGPLADAVRAALYRRGIPFRNTMSVKDLSQVRDYLQFLSLSLSYETLRVRHVRELFSGYSGFFDQKEDEYLLHKIEDHLRQRTKELADVMKNIRELTFQEVCDKVVRDVHRPQIKMLLEDMEANSKKVTSGLVNEMNYAVNNVDDLRHNEEIPDSEKKGVLLADCLRSVYVDRPFVIYLGLGPEWSSISIGKEYIDREAEAEQNMQRFSVLLQQGKSRLYAVNSMRNGKESCPSPVFEQIREYGGASEDAVSVTGFGDVCNMLIKGQWTPLPQNETVTRGEDIPDPSERKEWKFSKSSYNNYYACPRAFMFGRIISIPDSEKTMLGNIIHEFAEFYLCYPGLVEGRIEEYTEMIRERYSGLSDHQMKEIDGSKIRICMMNIKRFIDSLNIGDVPLDRDYTKREHKNMFMDMHGCTRYSSMTETRYDSKAHPLSGNFDLVIGSRIVDYKTGKAASLKEVKERMSTEKKQNYYEFQPLIYLSLLKDNSPAPHRFSLVYIADNDVRSVTDDRFRINENIREIVLIEENMKDFLLDQDSPAKGSFGPSYDKITGGWVSFVGRALDAGTDSCAAWKDDRNLIGTIMGSLGMKDGKTNFDKVSMALKKLSDIILAGMYIDGTEVLIPSDTLERFLSRIDKDHDAATTRMYSEFPPSPRKDCNDCDFFKVCTKDIIDTEEGGDDE